MTQTPVFSSAAEAADLARAGLRYLAAADPTQLTASEQAECLHDLERITAVTTAARASVLGGFTAGKGYCEDADYSPRSWLIHQTRITKGAWSLNHSTHGIDTTRADTPSAASRRSRGWFYGES